MFIICGLGSGGLQLMGSTVASFDWLRQHHGRSTRSAWILVQARRGSGLLRHSVSPKYIAFSPDGGKITKIQIGQSRVFIVDPNNPLAAQLYPALRTAQFRVENIDGAIKVSAQMLDREGHLIAELARNEWKVAPSPRTWERNYSDDALEVQDARGTVVLQVKVLTDRVQLQGLWWIDMGPPNGIRQLTVRETPPENPEGGAQFIISPQDASPPPIEPMFKYPSDRHLGELRKVK